ncbi:hypothetical protein ABT023_14150 [Micromonospora sp. NPDC002296]|uniref:hypothetical protein n=1 Tax=Micromonospora sp. NPDC002296 TaxID=3154271 RepID=UPI00333405AD
MTGPGVDGVVRDLGFSRAVLAALIPSLVRRIRAAKAAIEAMNVLYPEQVSNLAGDPSAPDLGQVDEWLIIGRTADGREVVTLPVPHERKPASVQHRSRPGVMEASPLAAEGALTTDDQLEALASAAAGTTGRPVEAEPVEIRVLSDWALSYLREHPGEHFSVRRLREVALARLNLSSEQVEHDRFRLALIEARTQDSALVQPNRKAWMYRRNASVSSTERDE